MRQYRFITRDQWLQASDDVRPRGLMPTVGRIYARRPISERWYQTTHEAIEAGNWGDNMNVSHPLDDALSWICDRVWEWHKAQ